MISKQEAETRGQPTCFLLANRLFDIDIWRRLVTQVKETGIFGFIVLSSNNTKLLEYAYEQDILVHRIPKECVDESHHMINLIGAYHISDVICYINGECCLTSQSINDCYDLLWEKDVDAVKAKGFNMVLSESFVGNNVEKVFAYEG